MMCTLPITAGTTMLAPLFCLGEMNRSYNIYELTPQDMVRKANNFSPFFYRFNFYEFKFVSRGDNWEAGDNRTFTLASTPMTFPVAWFGRDSIFVLRPVVANTIRFTADLTDSFDVEFNASNLASGIYFYTLQSDNFSSTKEMIFVK